MDLFKIKDRIEKLKEKEFKIQLELSDLVKELRANCPHNLENSDVKIEQIEGGYLDLSQTHTITFCGTCGKQLSRNIKYGSYA